MTDQGAKQQPAVSGIRQGAVVMKGKRKWEQVYISLITEKESGVPQTGALASHSRDGHELPGLGGQKPLEIEDFPLPVLMGNKVLGYQHRPRGHSDLGSNSASAPGNLKFSKPWCPHL